MFERRAWSAAVAATVAACFVRHCWRHGLPLQHALQCFLALLRRVLLREPALPATADFYYAVVDFECTCERGVRDYQHEIIEFPVAFLNSRTLKVDCEFHRFVRPTENPRLTAFCTELTGIAQGVVDASDLVADVLSEFDDFLRRRQLTPDMFAISTDGPWDVLSFLKKESQRKGIPLAGYWYNFVDIRQCFAAGFGVRRCGVKDMLGICGLVFEGREHSGIDDARNIARIAAEVLAAGHPLVVEPWDRRAYLPRYLRD